MATYAETILATPGLTGYWRLGEASGAAVDATGANNGTVAGVTYAQPGALTGDADTAYLFVTSGVEIANAAAFQVTDGSVEFWMKTATSGAGYHAVVIKENAYGVYMKDDFIGWFDWGAAADNFSLVNPTDNAWHHVVLTFDSATVNGSFLYIDGALAYTSTMTIGNQSLGVSIGVKNGGSGDQFTGLLDEVALYNVKLDLATIQAHYDIGVNGPPSTGNPYARIRSQFELRPY
jgi:hypothetical protein